MNENKSLMNILNNKGPSTERWGTQVKTLSHEIYPDQTLHYCFLPNKKFPTFRQNQKKVADVRTYDVNKLVWRPLQGQTSGPSEGNNVWTNVWTTNATGRFGVARGGGARRIRDFVRYTPPFFVRNTTLFLPGSGFFPYRACNNP